MGHTVTYTGYDNCHNSSVCEFQVVVEDNTAPICRLYSAYTVVKLTQDTKAWVKATSFDNGSYDECELQKYLWRMNPAPCAPCKTPQFPGYILGRIWFYSHYYYVSAIKQIRKLLQNSCCNGWSSCGIEYSCGRLGI